MHQYILSIDQGTTGSTSLIFDADLKIHGKATVEFPQHFPRPSWVEHDLDEIWHSVCLAVKIALEQNFIDPRHIIAIGITNQRETSCLWNRGNGAAFSRAIVWQDRRTADACSRLKAKGLEKTIHRRTGLCLDPYFSGTKLQWMLKNIPGAMALAKQGKLAFGTIDSYLVYRLSGNHVTDPSNASRTLLMNLYRCEWDEQMLDLFGIPRGLLPQILPTAVEYGKTRNFLNLPDGIPITGVAGDQQAALFGQACFTKGSVKCTYGTGAFMLANIGPSPIFSKHKLLTTVAWKLGDTVTYGLEGSAFIAGAAVQWLRDGLGVITKSHEIEALASSVPDSDGVTFVPALSGMGAPHWIAEATGLCTGITRRTTKAHIARAILDGIAFQVRELLEAMNKDFGRKLYAIKVDGGASANNLLMQCQADLLDVEVVRSKVMETTALGAGLQAGLGIGLWRDLEEIEKKWEASERFYPKLAPAQRKKEILRWNQGMRAVRILAKSP